jgi:hypothetical protein
VVKELPTDILLGVDNLAKLKINIDCSRKVVSINQKQINCILTNINRKNLNETKKCFYVNSLDESIGISKNWSDLKYE